MVIGESHERHDFSLKPLQCQAKMLRRPDATKGQEALAFEGCEWQDVPIGKPTQVQGGVLTVE
jgi:hypothetical protein